MNVVRDWPWTRSMSWNGAWNSWKPCRHIALSATWPLARFIASSCISSPTRGVQKVRRLTHLTTRYAHRILSLFNIDICNWNELGPAFLQPSVIVVEELLFLVFQPAIHRAIRTRMANTVDDGVAQSRHFGWRPVLEVTGDQIHCPGSKWLLFFSWTERIHEKTQNFLTTRTLSARRVAGWNTNNSSTTGSELWRNAGPSAFQLQVSMLKSDKIWWAYLVS